MVIDFQELQKYSFIDLLFMHQRHTFFGIFSPLPSLNGFFGNLNEIFQPNMTFEEIAEKFSPEIDKIFEKAHSKSEHSYLVRLTIYKIAKSEKYFQLVLAISDETSQEPLFKSITERSPKRSGRYWLDFASWSELQQEKEKILIAKNF